MTNIVRCSHCGTANRAGSNFCNRCGTDLRAQDDAQSIPPPVTPSEDERVDSAYAASLSTTPHPPEGETPSPEEGTQEQSDTNTRDDNLDDKKTAADIIQFASEKTDYRNTASGAEQIGEWGHTTEHAHTTAQTVDDRWPDRLVDGVQGLLEPIRIASDLGDDEATDEDQPAQPLFTVPATQLRRIRTLIAEDPTLVEHNRLPTQSAQVRLRYWWMIILLLAAIGVPLLFQLTGPVGEARQWPGVAEAYASIDALPADSTVWMFWAYDPATAGEMDLVALPLIDHLQERNIRATIITILPTGLATAQRAWQKGTENINVERGVGTLDGRTVFVEGAYLPGGAAALSLLATAPDEALWGHTARATNWLSLDVTQYPALTIAMAAYPEDVQHWLELVQTETRLTVVAFTGAAADPILRPYLATGQLAGLVSGFDGAAAYQQLRDQRFGRLPSAHYTSQLIAQNWGHAAFIFILILGNLRALWLGGTRG